MSLTKEEKEFISEMKKYLATIGVPKKEWSTLILEELNLRRKSKKVGSSRLLGKFKQKFGKIVEKFVSKRMGINQEELADLFDKSPLNMSNEEQQLFDSIFGGAPPKTPEGLSKQSVHFTDRSNKKRMIVYFDDDDLNEED